MQPDFEAFKATARKECLGCADCKGICHDLLELAFLPETVLRTTNRLR